MDGTVGKTLVQNNNTTSTWNISYTLPLSAFSERNVARAKAAAEIALLREKQKLERQDEAMKISLQYGDFLEAKTKLLTKCGKEDAKDDDCVPLVFQVRKAAAGLLCLAGEKAPASCTEWNDLPDKYARFLRVELFCIASLEGREGK